MTTESSLIANQGTRFDLGAFCTFTGTLTPTISETLDRLYLPPNSENSTKTVSTSKTTLQISQSSFTRDTKVVSEGELHLEFAPEQVPIRDLDGGAQYCLR